MGLCCCCCCCLRRIKLHLYCRRFGLNSQERGFAWKIAQDRIEWTKHRSRNNETLVCFFFRCVFHLTVWDKSSENEGTGDSDGYRDREKETTLALVAREKNGSCFLPFLSPKTRKKMNEPFSLKIVRFLQNESYNLMKFKIANE